MSLELEIDRHFAEHSEAIAQAGRDHRDEIAAMARLLAEALRAGGCVLWLGNGGSAGDAQHLAAELVGRFRNNRRALRSIALSTDTSVLTCVANDFGYDEVFARQVEALGRAGDVVVGISTSGNSENVIRALVKAKDLGLTTVALLGKGGGRLRSMADRSIVIGSDVTARIQEAHILIGHILCDLIEKELGIG